MSTDGPRTGLRSARLGRGWSQSRAGSELRALAAARGGPEASAASLKTQLSRWENGHALPDSGYRDLLTELYGRTARELGLVAVATEADGSGRQRFRVELAAAGAAGPSAVRQWTRQVLAAHRLDDEVGAAGSGEVTTALVAQLSRTLLHTLGDERRAAVAEPLSAAAALAARHALDREDPAAAWASYAIAASAAETSGSPVGVAVAGAGRAEVLRSVGEPAAADTLLADLAARPALGAGPAATHLLAARGITWAGLGRADEAVRALDRARHGLHPHHRRPDTGPGIPLVDPGPTSAGPEDVDLDVDHHHPGSAVELGDVLRWHGRALAVLGDGSASELLERALACAPRSVRHRAELHADLAVTHRAHDRAEAAVHHAREAHRLAERIGSSAISARAHGAREPG